MYLSILAVANVGLIVPKETSSLSSSAQHNADGNKSSTLRVEVVGQDKNGLSTVIVPPFSMT